MRMSDLPFDRVVNALPFAVLFVLLVQPVSR
jgi:hypothetical protein